MYCKFLGVSGYLARAKCIITLATDISGPGVASTNEAPSHRLVAFTVQCLRQGTLELNRMLPASGQVQSVRGLRFRAPGHPAVQREALPRHEQAVVVKRAMPKHLPRGTRSTEQRQAHSSLWA